MINSWINVITLKMLPTHPFLLEYEYKLSLPSWMPFFCLFSGQTECGVVKQPLMNTSARGESLSMGLPLMNVCVQFKHNWVA